MAHTRVAVVQIDINPAAFLQRRSLLEEPLSGLGKHRLLPRHTIPSSLEESAKALRARIRAAYVEQLWARLDALFSTCRRWGVQLVVLPEYSVPWELLSNVAAASKKMVIIAGSHGVEHAGRNACIYTELGHHTNPPAGTAVSPVFYNQRLLSLTPKLSEAKPEQGSLVLGKDWNPIYFDSPTAPPIPSPFGVMICLDFLFRERETHRNLVAPKLDATRFLAVPSYTPAHTTVEFKHTAQQEAYRYGRPVLYSNVASQGGTSIFVDEGHTDALAQFPEGVGVLEKGDEGVLVADIDLDYPRTGKITQYTDQPTVKPFAAASFVYRSHSSEEEYATWVVTNEERLLGGLDFEEAHRQLQAEVDKFDLGVSLGGSDGRAKRLERFRREIDGVVRTEELSRFTREVVLPPGVLPMPRVREALAAGAADAVSEWRMEHRGFDDIETALRKAAAPLLNLAHTAPTQHSQDTWENIRSAVGATNKTRAPLDKNGRNLFPRGLRITPFDKTAGGFDLIFRDDLNTLLTDDDPHSRQRAMGKYSSPEQFDVAEDLWRAVLARGCALPSIVWVIGETDTTVVVLYSTEDGRRVALAAGWGPGSDWTRTQADGISVALSSVLEGCSPLTFVEASEVASASRSYQEDLSAGAKRRIQQAVQLRAGSHAFVPPSVRSKGTSLDGMSELDRWLSDPGEEAIFLLGSFGTGKSTLLAKWAEHSFQDAQRLLVLVDLARSTETDPIGMICEAVEANPQDPKSRGRVGWLLWRGDLVAAFDGFDEMATRRTLADVEIALGTLFKIAGPRSKIVVAARDHYFASLNQTTGAQTRAAEQAGIRRTAFLYLEPFGEREVELAIRHTFSNKNKQKAVLAKIRRTYDLGDLVQNPLLLRMVLSTIDTIDENATVGPTTIYEEYLDRWLDNSEVGDPEFFSKENKQAFAEILAAKLWATGEASIDFRELHRAVRAQFTGTFEAFPDDATPESAFLEIQGGSFLVREGEDRFRFAHRSFLEFFLARGLLKRLPLDAETALDTKPLSIEVSAFVAELVREHDREFHPALATTRQWLVSRGTGDLSHTAAAAANGFRLLRDVPRALGESTGWFAARTDLRDTKFESEDFRGLRLHELRGEGVEWTGIDLSDADLNGANLAGANLSCARIHCASLENVDFSNASLKDVDANRSSLRGARFDRALLHRSVWTECSWKDVSFRDTSCSTALMEGLDLKGMKSPSNASLRAVRRHQAGCYAVDWAPTGRLVAVPCHDGAVRLWNARMGRLVAEFFVHRSPVRQARWARSAKILATASDDGSSALVDVSTGLVCCRQNAHSGAVTDVVWSPDDTQLASMDANGEVLVWSAEDGQVAHRLTGSALSAKAIGWAPSGGKLAVAYEEGSVRVWDTLSGDARLSADPGGLLVNSLNWSPDGTRVALGCEDGSLRLWTQSRNDIEVVTTAHLSRVSAVAWSPDGTRIATSSFDSSVRVWDLGSEDHILVLDGGKAWALDVSWSKDGSLLASAHSNQSVSVWSASDGVLVSSLNGDRTVTRSVAWTHDAEHLAIASGTQHVQVFDAMDSSLACELTGHREAVSQLAWSHDKSRIASGSRDSTVRIWSSTDGSELCNIPAGRVSVLAWAFRDTCIAAAWGGPDAAAAVWNARTGARVLHHATADLEVVSLSWSPDDTRVSFVADDHVAWVWKVTNAQRLFSVVRKGGSGHLVWSPLSDLIASSSHEEGVQILDGQNGTQLAFLRSEGPTPTPHSWSRDGSRIVCNSGRSDAQIWNVADASVAATISMDGQFRSSIKWSPDNNFIAAISTDERLAIWSSQDGKLLAVLEGGDGSVDLAWCSDSRRLVSSTEHANVQHIWSWDGSEGSLLATYVFRTGQGPLIFTPDGFISEAPRKMREIALSQFYPLGSLRTYSPLAGLTSVVQGLELRNILSRGRARTLAECRRWRPSDPSAEGR